MAGRRKKTANLTLEEQLEIVQKEITECEEQLKALKGKRKELNSQLEDAQKERLYRAVVQSGRSIEEILDVISEKKDENA